MCANKKGPPRIKVYRGQRVPRIFPPRAPSVFDSGVQGEENLLREGRSTHLLFSVSLSLSPYFLPFFFIFLLREQQSSESLPLKYYTGRQSPVTWLKLAQHFTNSFVNLQKVAKYLIILAKKKIKIAGQRTLEVRFYFEGSKIYNPRVSYSL
jgi:hypothetical protein